MPERQPPNLTQPRQAGEVVATAFGLCASYPGLFLLPPALIIIPYQLILLTINTSTLITKHGRITSTLLILALINLVIVVPLIATLAMQALVAVAEARRPSLISLFGQTLRVFPEVAAAQVVASVLIAVGLFALIVPGLIIAVRLIVTSQTAAYEQTKWPTTLGRSFEVTSGSFLHIVGTLLIALVMVFAIALIVTGIAGSLSGGARDGVLILLDVLAQSFGVTMLAVLYFDLRARES